MLMSEIEIIADGGRRRRWSAADKLRIVEETMYDGESISAVARRNGVALNLLYRWGEAHGKKKDDFVAQATLLSLPRAEPCSSLYAVRH